MFCLPVVFPVVCVLTLRQRNGTQREFWPHGIDSLAEEEVDAASWPTDRDSDPYH